MSRHRQPPPPLALVVAGAVAQRALPGRRATPVSRVAAAGLAALSAATLLAPVAQFARRGTTVDPRDGAEPARLVTTGLNAWSRNPMYVAMVGLLSVHPLHHRSPLAVLPTMAFVTWIDRRQIPAEERALLHAFGAEYERYRSRVPRWIGPRRR
ncbi:hypothetical protein GCM10027055_11940 [Janibacter alkaliphilus]|uniref:Protein-S-isoprenylcysteine O-methyltransferase Ste14 n=1 Tax=Janibacter alkaliphilus TaxID=1069963 RepID=A0A852XH02_9MICO|nr:protein-S-isoprenylcysteine O-methyltransferase Ste14 [Janibacter alkaliphilus]